MARTTRSVILVSEVKNEGTAPTAPVQIALPTRRIREIRPTFLSDWRVTDPASGAPARLHVSLIDLGDDSKFVTETVEEIAAMMNGGNAE